LEEGALRAAAKELAHDGTQFRTGQKIGNYEIQQLLGSGGMGEVYRARDTKLDRDVAIKVLPEAFTTDPERLARFRREAQVLASLNHPNIGHIYGLEDGGASPALVLEYIEGRTLAERIAHQGLALSDALPIARQIAEALEAAHEHGIAHRDLKPANIKVKDDGTVKVLDFGLAKALSAESSRAAADLSNVLTNNAYVTTPGVVFGTAAYMPPEQAKGAPVDRRADIWAFGAVFYEMLSGQRAFKGRDTATTLAAVLTQDVDWTALPTSTPEPVRRLIARCLDRDVRRRLRDIGEARIVLDDSLLRGPVVPPAARVSPRRLVWGMVSIALVAITALAVTAAYLYMKEPEQVSSVIWYRRRKRHSSIILGIQQLGGRWA
jgi:serine/threonine-protein kinase